jgi:proteasome accessory factor B
VAPGSKVDGRERILSLLLALLYTERPLTIEELRTSVPGYEAIAEFESFRRQFERDKQVLVNLGVTIDKVTGDPDQGQVGYQVDRKRYYLDVPPLTTDELAALRIAITLIDAGDHGVDALLRLGGLEPPERAGDTAAALPASPGPVAEVPMAEGIGVLFDAVVNNRSVEFTYPKGGTRRVHPLRMDLVGDHWMLTTHDLDQRARRVFRVDKIIAITSVGANQSFRRDPDEVVPKPAIPLYFEVDEPIEAIVHVNADQAASAVRQAGQRASVAWNDDGSVVLGIPTTNRAALRWFVLEWLEHAELLGPPELRDDLVAWLEELA